MISAFLRVPTSLSSLDRNYLAITVLDDRLAMRVEICHYDSIFE